MQQNKNRNTFIIGFAVFSMFFGAGNLSLPPHLGVQNGSDWIMVTLGFILSGVVLPILAIYAHSKLQGSLYDFGKKISPLFSIIFCVVIYIIAVVIPSPRTASFAHEVGIEPYFQSHSLLTSSIYFTLVFLFAIKRRKILDLIGKFLTPLILIILSSIILIGLNLDSVGVMTTLNTPQKAFTKGFLEGYQTFDAIGGMVVGGVIIISLNLMGYTSFKDKQNTLIKSGIMAGVGLIVMYTGLIALGAYNSNKFDQSDI